jgi:DNA-binding LytR/AlgR family response regulator
MTEPTPTAAPGRRFTALLADDEDLARALLLEHLAGHPEVQVLASCRDGFEAIRAAAEQAPDLLFLDIQMPGLDPPRQFLRIHRSYILRLDRLAQLEKTATQSWVAVLTDGTRLPVSRSGYARLARALET